MSKPEKSWKELRDTFFATVVEETFDERGVDALDWSEHYGNLIDIGNAILGDPGARDSLVAARVLEMFKQLFWIQNSVLHGAYHSAIRDLRFILEAVVHAYAFWREHPEVSMDEKYDFLLEREMQGSRRVREVFQATGLAYEGALYDLYRDLCKYCHPGARELSDMLRPVTLEHRLAFHFHAESFELTRTLTARTMDAWWYVLLSRFPSVRTFVAGDEPTMASLRELGQTMTLSLLGNAENT